MFLRRKRRSTHFLGGDPFNPDELDAQSRLFYDNILECSRVKEQLRVNLANLRQNSLRWNGLTPRIVPNISGSRSTQPQESPSPNILQTSPSTPPAIPLQTGSQPTPIPQTQTQDDTRTSGSPQPQASAATNTSQPPSSNTMPTDEPSPCIQVPPFLLGTFRYTAHISAPKSQPASSLNSASRVPSS